ncbi:MAG: LysR substrate-binding domain-containing protein [Sphingobium sp.]
MPSLNALRALEAAGRRGSLSSAANELGVTVGAVSRHITLLEGYFGRTLLRRQTSGVEPTADCAAYLASLGRAFEEIDTASHRLATERQSDNTLRLRFYSTFTTEWLSGRLPEFRALHPEIQLEFSLSIKDAAWRDDDFDMALTGQPPASDEFRRDRLFETYLALVCSPVLLKDRQWIEPAELVREALLTSPRETELWRPLLKGLRVPATGHQPSISFDSLSMTYQAARCGAGIALGNLFLIADDLRERRLVLPINQVFAAHLPHYVVTRRGRPDRPALTAFRSWLLNATRDAEADLDGLLRKHVLRDMPLNPNAAGIGEQE